MHGGKLSFTQPNGSCYKEVVVLTLKSYSLSELYLTTS